MMRSAIGSRLAGFCLLLSSLAASAASPEFPDAVENARLLGTTPLKGQLFHVQGVELDEERIWVTSVSRWRGKGYIHEFDRATGAFRRRLELTDGPRFHPGGIAMHGNSIWVPVAEYKAGSSAVLLEVDKTSLQVRRRIQVADHLGCVAATGSTLIAGNWDSRLFYIFDLTGAKPVRAVRNPTRTRYQDMKLVNGQLVAGGLLTGQSGAIDWIDLDSLTPTRTLRTGATASDGPMRPARAFTGEGMAIQGRDLYLVPEDGPSRVYHFRLDSGIGAVAMR